MGRIGLAAVMFIGFVAAACVADEMKTVRDFGAVGDGKADDTGAIEKAVAARLGEIRFSSGTYRLTRTVVVDLDKVGPVSLNGSGATARLVMAGPGPAIHLIGTHKASADPRGFKPNVWQRQRAPMIDGLEIVGDHPEACGIEASGTMQLTITRVVVRRTLHAIHLTGLNRNVLIGECHLYDNRGAGVYYDHVDLHQSNITGCHVSYNQGGGIVARGGNVRNVHIAGCDIEANVNPDAPTGANVLVDCSGKGPGVAEIAITGCTIQHASGADAVNVRFLGADDQDRRWGNLAIIGNVITDASCNIDMQKARGVIVSGNTFSQVRAADLLAEGCSNIVVGANIFDRNPPYGKPIGGLVFRDCEDCSLSGMHLNGLRAKTAALELEKCRRFLISNCVILDCAGAGILLKDVSDTRMHGCMIRHAKPDADWAAVKQIDGRNNSIE